MKSRIFVAAIILFTALLVIHQLNDADPAPSVKVSPPQPDEDPAPLRVDQPVFKQMPVKAVQPRTELDIRPDKLIMPEQDNEALLQDALDRERKKLTYRFATRVPVGKKASEIGIWKKDGGIATWQLDVEAPNATSLNFAIDHYHMPPGGEFRLIGAGKGEIYTFTSADNEAHGELWKFRNNWCRNCDSALVPSITASAVTNAKSTSMATTRSAVTDQAPATWMSPAATVMSPSAI